MDRHSILEPKSSSRAGATDALPPRSFPSEPLFPGEDAGQSLAQMAKSDFEATLQLLAERAQDLTGASGAAIALCNDENSDMVCRASAGSNAPELGAVLSMQFGLSGESVRTHQALCCEDTETDSRVNREGCRQLGIASVVVMPIVRDGQVLGIFELFSGQPRAFDEHDLAALQRLSEMAEMAVRYAAVSQTPISVQNPHVGETERSSEPMGRGASRLETAASAYASPIAPPEGAIHASLKPDEMQLEKTNPDLISKKPLFWSAPLQPASTTRADEAFELTAIPPELRDWQKCQACGFPVSQERTFCVECEEKQWRAQSLPHARINASSEEYSAGTREAVPEAIAVPDSSVVLSAPPGSAVRMSEADRIEAQTLADFSNEVPESPSDSSTSDARDLFSGSSTQGGSWLAANKFTLGALLVIAIAIILIAALR